MRFSHFSSRNEQVIWFNVYSKQDHFQGLHFNSKHMFQLSNILAVRTSIFKRANIKEEEIAENHTKLPAEGSLSNRLWDPCYKNPGDSLWRCSHLLLSTENMKSTSNSVVCIHIKTKYLHFLWFVYFLNKNNKQTNKKIKQRPLCRRKMCVMECK